MATSAMKQAMSPAAVRPIQTGYEPSPQPLSKATRFAPDFSSVSSAAISSPRTNSSVRGARAAEDAS
jgi:hypothetical protein